MKEKPILSLEDAIRSAGLQNGMTVSFHHHLRNGDKVVNTVMETIANMGYRDICLAASGIFPCHAPLVPLMERGVITRVSTSTFNPGPVPKAISHGALRDRAVLMTHGGRPRAISQGELPIHVAFIAAPACDKEGNLSGAEGPSACGCLSYAYADAACADYVVAVTDHIVPSLSALSEIPGAQVDCIVKLEQIGDPGGIVSGSTKISDDPIRRSIAARAADLVEQTGYLRNGISLQTGASSIALAVAAEISEKMKRQHIRGSFGCGGIHGAMVQMLHDGLFEKLLDVQCFDLAAVNSAASDEQHITISASRYANPADPDCVVHQLDVVILGAAEIDLDFNVNVITGSDGIILGASGGHSDCAAGAKLAIVVSNLMKKNRCLVKKHVTTCTTPGSTIDVLVTDYGVAVNPRREDLLQKLSGFSLVSMQELLEQGAALGAAEDHPRFTSRIVADVQYRDGTVIDHVYQIEEGSE